MRDELNTVQGYLIDVKLVTVVTVRSKALVCRRLTAGIAGSNSAGSMDDRLM
jgi:hypothetical protein